MSSNTIRALAGFAVAVAWSAIAAYSKAEDLIVHLAVFSGVVAAICFALDRTALTRRFRVRLSSLAIGIVGGVVMALATHALYAATSSLLPGVRAPVIALYSVLRQGLTGPGAVVALFLVVAAEEVIFRGVVLELQGKTAVRVALATGIYALAQVGMAEPLLVLVGALCGVVWSAERIWRGDLVAPLATHLVWDLLVMVLFPLH